jgi:hypothetical protein
MIGISYSSILLSVWVAVGKWAVLFCPLTHCHYDDVGWVLPVSRQVWADQSRPPEVMESDIQSRFTEIPSINGLRLPPFIFFRSSAFLVPQRTSLDFGRFVPETSL